MLDRAGGIPLYRQIHDHLRAGIEGNQWRVGERLPTEQQLCEQFGVSRITVVRALNRLADEGMITKTQGKGTFVSAPKWIPEPRTLLSFTEEMAERGMTPGSHIISSQLCNPSARLAERLQLAPESRVWRIERLLTANGDRVGLQRAHLPEYLFPSLGNMIKDGASLYDLLASSFGVYPERAIERYSSVLLDDDECGLLDVQKGQSAFAVERLTFSGSIPVEFVQSLMRSDRYQFTVEVKRRTTPPASPSAACPRSSR